MGHFRYTFVFFCCVLMSPLISIYGRVIVGAERTALYYPLIKQKQVAVLSNHTGMIGDKHLVDILVADGINVTGIFAPEHGFRGTADAGERVSSSVDEKTGIPIWSLYDKKGGQISGDVLKTFDVVLVDIQDVGLRFYTYYITMVKMMDFCAEHGKEVVVLDRPNPNGHYVDGPILDLKYRSGVGWLPIPVVHGLTLGELALMTNGEGWLTDGRQCQLSVIACDHYNHQTHYELPVAPSPNLPTMKSVYLYPSTCYFEATPVSLGRGTNKPFMVYGHPEMHGYHYRFTPRSMAGAKRPPQMDKECFGVDLSQKCVKDIWAAGIDLSYLIDAYRNLNMGNRFFSSFFEKLIGVGYVRTMIEQGCSADEIKAMWADDVARFKVQRRPYLLYDE